MSKSVTDPLHYLVNSEKKDTLSLSKGIFVEEITYPHTNTKETEGEKKIDILICGLSSRPIIHPEKYRYCHSSQAGRLIGTAVAEPRLSAGKAAPGRNRTAKGLPGVTI